MLLATPLATSCDRAPIDWTDPMTLSAAVGDGALVVDEHGRAHLVADAATPVTPADDSRTCVSTVRAARLDDQRIVAVWFAVRADSSVVLRSSVSPDGGRRWLPAVPVDTSDVGSEGCQRGAPSIAASAGFVHVAYGLHGNEGTGVFYAHSMTQGQSYEPAVAMVYGDRLTKAAVAADRGVVAVAFEDPNDPAGQIALALSTEWGHIFGERMRVSTGIGGATDPQVAVRQREVAVAWRQGGGPRDRDASVRATHVVRVGRLP